jgi:hypothetical protein
MRRSSVSVLYLYLFCSVFHLFQALFHPLHEASVSCNAFTPFLPFPVLPLSL